MRTDKDKKGLAIIALIAITLIGVLGYRQKVVLPPKPGPDFCAGPITANAVVLIDHSEAMTPQTMAEMESRVLQYARLEAVDNERFTLFTLDANSGKDMRPLASLCKPRSTGNRLIEDVRPLEKNRKLFEDRLSKLLRLRPSDSPASPLAQSLIDFSLSQYLRGTTNTLLVFSDLLENTPEFSLYSCSSESEAISQFRKSRVGAIERPTFLNTKVRLNVIPRFDIDPDALKCRDRFWLWFFGDNQGENTSVRVDYLPGGRIK